MTPKHSVANYQVEKQVARILGVRDLDRNHIVGCWAQYFDWNTVLFVPIGKLVARFQIHRCEVRLNRRMETVDENIATEHLSLRLLVLFLQPSCRRRRCRTKSCRSPSAVRLSMYPKHTALQSLQTRVEHRRLQCQYCVQVGGGRADGRE